MVAIALALLIIFTPHFKNEDNTLSFGYYCFLLGPIRTLENVSYVKAGKYTTYTVTSFRSFSQVLRYLLQIALNAFMVRISDPRFGGMYLTLLNTVNNIGSQWPYTLRLWATKVLTIKHLTEDNKEVSSPIFGSLWTRGGDRYSDTPYSRRGGQD